MLHNALRCGGGDFPKNNSEGVQFKVISVTMDCVGVKYPEKSITQHLNGTYEAELMR